MISTYVENIATYFKNMFLNAVGSEKTLYEYLASKKVDKAIELMEDNHVDVDNAISEYYPQKHKINSRTMIYSKKGNRPLTCRVARARQRYINEVELFFLLGNNIVWKNNRQKDDNDEHTDDRAFVAFKQFLKEYHFDTNMRKAKRLAGAETESAKLYHIYKENVNGKEEVRVDCVVLARSTGYTLRPLFDQYGNLTAFAYGYKLKEGTKQVQHWDILTSKAIYYCKKLSIGWDIKEYPNIIGKIPLIYYKQPKAWDGAEPLLEREEELLSKLAELNNTFSDPSLVASADAVASIMDDSGLAKIIQVKGQGSDVHYLEPPQSSESRRDEISMLVDAIHFDTFTPDLHVNEMKGFGSLSADAIENAMAIGFIKRANRMEIYSELLAREKNVIIEICKLLNPDIPKEEFDALDLSFEFAMPFAADNQKQWGAITALYNGGLLSLEKAVEMLSLTDAPQEELDRIRMQQTEKLMAEQELATEKAQEQAVEQPNIEE